MEISQEILDAYVLDRLDQEIRSEMDREIEKDPLLKEELDLHRFVIEGINAFGQNDFLNKLNEVEEILDQYGFFSDEAEFDVIKGIEDAGAKDFKSILEEVESGLESESFFEKLKNSDTQKERKMVNMYPMRKLLSIAATVAVLVTAGFWFFNDGPSNEELYDMHFAALPDQISSEIEVEMIEIGFGEGDDEILSSLKETMTLYNKDEFLEFLDQIPSYVKNNQLGYLKNDLLLYQGVAEMSVENYSSALNTFKQITEPDDKVLWYQALALIWLGELENAKILLEKIQEPAYSPMAKSILEQL